MKPLRADRRSERKTVPLRNAGASAPDGECGKKFRVLFKSLTQGVVYRDARDAVIDANPAALKMLGCARKELLSPDPSRPGWILTGEDGLPLRPADHPSKVALRTGRPVRGVRVRVIQSRSGNVRRLIVDAVPEFRGGGKTPFRVLVILQDVTERKRLEIKLREDEEKYRTLFGTSDEAILLMIDEMFIDCNDRSVRLYGCSSKEDLIGHSPWEFSPPAQPDGRDSREKARAYIAAAVAGAPQRFYWRHRRKDGGLIETEVCLNGLVLNNRIHVQAIVQDIGERKRAEEEIQRSLREKETLLREIYHRTKNNMNVIGAMLSLKSRAIDDERIAAVFRDIEDKIRAMALVHRKLYESKDLHRIDLKDYVSDLAAQLAESHPEAAAAVEVKLDLEELPVPIDVAIPCGMILNELFSNVYKHAFPGSGRGEIRIRLARSTDGKTIELDFADNGGGVPPGFDLLAQATLGLQTLVMLVEHQLRGAVRFETEKGVICLIRFPCKAFFAEEEA